MLTFCVFQGMNCEKNAVVCEGYHEKQIWKSGREKAEEGKAFYRLGTDRHFEDFFSS